MNKKTKIAVIGIIALVLVTIGVTYAYWLITRTQEGENVITTGCLDITLNGENDITLAEQFPMSDEDGMKLTPYSFTVTNNCNTSVDYQVALEALEAGDEISSDALKVALDNTTKLYSAYSEAAITIDEAYEARKMIVGTLSSKNTEGSTATHKLRIWIDENASINEMNKSFQSKISVTVGQGIVAGKVLPSLILADAETNGYLKTETPNFSTATIDGEYGIYSAEDDYGTSYYFRGDVENNYVKFGTWNEENVEYLPDGDTKYGTYSSYEECMAPIQDGAPWTTCEKSGASKGDAMYWRIVRINGNGTIRLVYDGTTATAERDNHIVSIGVSAYNEIDGDAKYVGYTYDVDGVQTDSTIKGVVETWYANNLEADYGSYIADSIFCNDRQVTSTSDSTQYYGAYDRLRDNTNPKLICSQENDKYTVSDNIGNGLLSKPIGLLTADEVVFAGGLENDGDFGNDNLNYYQYSGATISWLMSPGYYTGQAFGWYFGGASIKIIALAEELAIRPVVNLKADVEFTGNGTIDSPYEIVME